LGLLPTLSQLRPDVIVCSGYSAQTIQALLWRRLSGCAVAIWTEAHVHEYRSLRTRMAHIADAFIVAGSMSAARVAEMGVSAEEIFIAYNSVDPKLYAPSDHEVTASRMPVFVSVGQLIDRKGVLDIAAASRCLHSSGIAHQLVFIGDGPLRPELEREALTDGLPWAVKGWLEPPEVAVAISAASAMILASHMDLNPLVLVEALCSGTPVVVSDGVGSVVDHVNEGVNGWVFPSGGTRELASIMRGIALGSTRTTDRLAVSSDAQVRFSPTVAASRMFAAIEHALAGREAK
jgi:glycosyltransferase involved in cell wall biosynthesis